MRISAWHTPQARRIAANITKLLELVRNLNEKPGGKFTASLEQLNGAQQILYRATNRMIVFGDHKLGGERF